MNRVRKLEEESITASINWCVGDGLVYLGELCGSFFRADARQHHAAVSFHPVDGSSEALFGGKLQGVDRTNDLPGTMITVPRSGKSQRKGCWVVSRTKKHSQVRRPNWLDFSSIALQLGSHHMLGLPSSPVCVPTLPTPKTSLPSPRYTLYTSHSFWFRSVKLA